MQISPAWPRRRVQIGVEQVDGIARDRPTDRDGAARLAVGERGDHGGFGRAVGVHQPAPGCHQRVTRSGGQASPPRISRRTVGDRLPSGSTRSGPSRRR